MLLLGLASPTLGLTFGLPDERVLPAHVSSRVVQQEIRDGFAAEEMDAIQVLPPGRPGGAGLGAANGAVNRAANRAAIEATALVLSRIPAVHQVDALTGSYSEGRKIAEPNGSAARFEGDKSTWYSVVATHRGLDRDVDRLLSDIRTALPGAQFRRNPPQQKDIPTPVIDPHPPGAGLIKVAP
ncbi:hypothetical protein ACFVX6_16855, partial [Streptomyces sp. NPDC058289]